MVPRLQFGQDRLGYVPSELVDLDHTEDEILSSGNGTVSHSSSMTMLQRMMHVFIIL